MHNILRLKEQNRSQEWWVARWDVYGKMTKGILGKVGSAGYYGAHVPCLEIGLLSNKPLDQWKVVFTNNFNFWVQK